MAARRDLFAIMQHFMPYSDEPARTGDIIMADKDQSYSVAPAGPRRSEGDKFMVRLSVCY